MAGYQLAHAGWPKKVNRSERARRGFFDQGKGTRAPSPENAATGLLRLNSRLSQSMNERREATPPFGDMTAFVYRCRVARRGARPVERAARPEDAAGVIYRGLSA
jgi:hypothetical protein